MRNHTSQLNFRPSRRASAAVVEELEVRLALSVSVLTYHYDTSRSGVDSAETQLAPPDVKTGSFGKSFSTPVDGQVYAEPLIDTGVTITTGVNTVAGAGGVHGVAYVATQNDSLYAIDATSGAILWQRSFLDTTNPTGDQNNTLGATSISTVSSSDVNSTDVNPSIGITGTPVIDPTNHILYLVAKTKELIGGTTFFVQRVHAIKLSDGTDAVAPYLVGQTDTSGNNTTQIYAYGSGDGSVTDPYNNTGKSVVQFDALTEAQRPALSLVNGNLYIAWASHGDNGPYHGWVVRWNVSTLSTSGFQLAGVLNTCPNNGLSGIWQGGGGLAFEPNGSAFYFVTGNGSAGAPTLNSSGFPTDASYNEAVVKVVADATSTPQNQNPNGWGLKVSDYFIPHDVANLDNADSDFGSGAPILLPDSAGITGHPHLLVVGGKDGRLFVLDRDNLGHYNTTNDASLNSVPDGSGNNTPPNQVAGTLSTPTYFNSTLYAVGGYNGPAYAFSIGSTGTLSQSSQTSIGNFGYLPGSTVVSANGTTNGIVWVMDTSANELHAYDATSLSTELWNSGQAPSDALGNAVKFAVPTVANGMVYVGTQGAFVAYGLLQPPTTVSGAPVLSATALSGSSVNLTWTDASAKPNVASEYVIEESTDGKNFTQVATAPQGATSIAIAGLTKLTKYYFRIRGSNSLGNSKYSNIANTTTTAVVNAIDFPGGFAGAGMAIALNGAAKLNAGNLELTDGGTAEASSAYFATPVDITKFATQFTFNIGGGSGTGDGFTFVLQNSGTTALGPTGGGLGYGPDTLGGTGGIGNSIAVKFDLYSNNGEGVDSTGLYTNGASPTTPATDLSTTGIDLHSGDTMLVNLTYDGTTLTEVILDTVTNASVTETNPIDIPATIGSGTAYAGFTGGTGGATAMQKILNWTYQPTSIASPAAPSGLGAVAASANTVTLNWTNNATNQSGYHLDRATDAAFTQNLVTESLPSTGNSFTDALTGLAPGNTYFYRLRAFNSAGDSGNSNTATVTIPLGPPAPTLVHVAAVTTTQINISWQDNAGHAAQGYKILRSVNSTSPVVIVSLPPTSRKAPSTYLWSDTKLTPGAIYHYTVEAYNVSGNSAGKLVTVETLTAAPKSLAAKVGAGYVSLSWAKVKGAVSYDIYRGTSPTKISKNPIAKGITTTSFRDSTARRGVKYYYYVTAINDNGVLQPLLPKESIASSIISATPK